MVLAREGMTNALCTPSDFVLSFVDIGQGQRRHRVVVLAVQVEQLPAGHQQFHSGQAASRSASSGAAVTTCSKLSRSRSICLVCR